MRPFGSTFPPFAKKVVDRHLVQLLGDRIRLVGARGLDGLQILRDARIGAGMHHVRHAPGLGHEALRPCPVLVVEVPVEALGQDEALRGL
jgi:hypothetical protein